MSEASLVGVWRMRNNKKVRITHFANNLWHGHLIEDIVATPLKFKGMNFFVRKPELFQWDLMERLSERDDYPEYL